jgi:hypothetical protein
MAEVEVENEHGRDLPPLRGGVLHVEELPMADHRDHAYQMIRDAPGATITADWPAALIGLDHLQLVFPHPTNTATRTTP